VVHGGQPFDYNDNGRLTTAESGDADELFAAYSCRLWRGIALHLNKLSVNFGLNVAGMLAPIIIALVTVPIYIFYIGAARYGTLSIIWILLGYFGFLDFGLSRASANALARISQSSSGVWASVFITSLYLNFLLGVVGAIAVYFVGSSLLPRFLPLTLAMGSEVQAAFGWIACLFPVALLASVTRGAIEARERFFVVNVLDIIGFSLGQILPILFAIFIGPSLVVIIPAALLARVLSFVLNLVCVAHLENLRTLRVFDRSHLRQLLSYGMWVSLTSVISPLLTSADQLLVGSTLGAVSVAHYAVPMNLVSRSQIISTALARTLFPRFSRLAHEEAMLLAKKAMVSLGYSFGAICGPGIILARPFMSLWLGADFASQASPVLELLLVGAWFNGIAYLPYAFLQGQGRPDLIAKLHAIEFLPYILLLWLLVHQYGLVGAALAWNVRVAVDAALLLRFSRFPLYHLTRLIPGFVLLLVSYMIARLPEISAVWSVLLAGLAFLTFSIFTIIFDATARKILLAFRGHFVSFGS
jgi:O-antigen/teichoic acid export membrane protein